jgi:hypothetical protein
MNMTATCSPALLCSTIGHEGLNPLGALMKKAP